MIRRSFYILILVLSAKPMQSGCDAPKLKTSNGIYYFWTERGVGQEKNFTEGDSIDFSITVKCHGLTGPTNIYCDGVLQLNFPAQRGIYVRLPGKARSEERRVGKECRSRWSP